LPPLLDRHDEFAKFSNWGAKSVAIAAPGVDILSTWLGNAYELKKKLLASTDPIVALKGKTVTGGRINAAKALN